MRDRRAGRSGRGAERAITRADQGRGECRINRGLDVRVRAGARGGGFGAAARALAATSQDNMPARQRSRSLSRTHGEIGRRSGDAPRARVGRVLAPSGYLFEGRVIATIERCGVRLTARVAALRVAAAVAIGQRKKPRDHGGSRNALVAVGLPHHHGVGVGGLAGGDHGGLVEDGGDGGGESGHCDFWCDGVCVVSCEYVTMWGTRPRFSRNDPTPEIYSRPSAAREFWVHRPPVAPDSLSTSFSAELSRAGPRFGNQGNRLLTLQSISANHVRGSVPTGNQRLSIKFGRAVFPFDRGSR